MLDTPDKPKLPDPCSLVIFGVTGDLTHRLVTPALYNLAESNLLPEDFASSAWCASRRLPTRCARR